MNRTRSAANLTDAATESVSAAEENGVARKISPTWHRILSGLGIVLAGCVVASAPAEASAPSSYDDCPASSMCLWGSRDGAGVMLAVPGHVGRWPVNFVPFSARNNTSYSYCLFGTYGRPVGTPLSMVLPNMAANLNPVPYAARALAMC